MKLKLRQSQVWKLGGRYLRIVQVERLSVDFKTTPSLHSRSGAHHRVTKKEFCRLLKDATLVSDQEIAPPPPRVLPVARAETAPRRRRR